MHIPFSSLLTLLPLFSLVLASPASTTATSTSTTETSTVVLLNPSLAATSAVIGTGSNGYTYAGCYNETTGVTGSSGVRALTGGSMVSSPYEHTPL